jgi:hypothetical protein
MALPPVGAWLPESKGDAGTHAAHRRAQLARRLAALQLLAAAQPMHVNCCPTHNTARCTHAVAAAKEMVCTHARAH